MSKSIAFTGALVAALLVASAGTAAAQSTDGLSSGGLDSSSISGSSDVEGDYLGSAGELLPGSVTGSLPGGLTVDGDDSVVLDVQADQRRILLFPIG